MQEENHSIVEQSSGDAANANKHTTDAARGKERYWKFIMIFLGIMIAAVFVLPAIADRLNKRELQAKDDQLNAYVRSEHAIQERLRNDTDGGATPEETLQLFVAALKKGDLAQANKYFVIYPEDRQQKLIEGLRKKSDDGQLPDVIRMLEVVKRDKQLDGVMTTYFRSKVDGKSYWVEFEKGKYSAVWKLKDF